MQTVWLRDRVDGFDSPNEGSWRSLLVVVVATEHPRVAGREGGQGGMTCFGAGDCQELLRESYEP